MSSFEVEDVLSKLTQKEKIALTTGANYWHTLPLQEHNVPSIRMSDGPNGIRGQWHFNSTPTATIPVGTALGASWNKDLLFRIGKFLDHQARAKGVHVVLAPTVNIQRIPNGGRGFESISEDPVLSGELAAQYINGLQEDGLAATIKHFIGNDQENERFSSDSIISERALREIYLKPFEIAIEKSNPKAIMTSYNRVNGVHVSEDPKLLNGLIRDEWGWSGLIMSDWTGVYSTAPAINAGLDLEMPGPGNFRQNTLFHSLLAKTITEETLNDRARNVLQLVKDVQASGLGENLPETARDTPEDRALLREAAAEGAVLLKNRHGVLPLAKDKKTLVIGPNATFAAYSGGGSALATPTYKVTPLQAIKEKLGESNVKYSLGAYNHRYMPSLGAELFHGGSNGTLMEIFHDPPSTTGRKPFDVIVLKDINYFRMNDYTHPDLKSNLFYATLQSTFIPNNDGLYEFGIAVYGTARLFINDKLVLDNATNQVPGESFYGAGTPEVRAEFRVEKGKEYKYRIEFGSGITSELVKNGLFFGGGGLRSGGVHLIKDEEAIDNAVKDAQEFDQVIIVTGLSHDYESEGADRPDLKIPGHSDRLITEILKVKPDAVVVIQAGTPVELPWADKAKAILYSSFSGNETGSGIADVLFGDVNPSGKLPITFPVRFEDTPSFINNTTYQGRVLYGEDVFVGYRYFEKVGREVLFPFGHGLSYTRFKLSQLSVTSKDDILFISVNVENAGPLAGSAVIQVYVANSERFRPKKELKEFGKQFLQSGESSTITFELSVQLSTSGFDAEIHKWVSKAGEYEIIIGQSSEDPESLTEKFEVEQTTKYLRKLVN